jgi:hypothetical protein
MGMWNLAILGVATVLALAAIWALFALLLLKLKVPTKVLRALAELLTEM